MVIHSCDNPPCVRPDHLRVGTAADNSADMVAKGRQIRGAAVNTARLDATRVRMVRSLYASGFTQQSVAAALCISQCQVSKIVLRQCWRSVA